jgi:hypothetical protein
MRCVLHIGTEKTGTTALQSALSGLRDSLSEQGMFYAGAPGDLNSRRLAAVFTPFRVSDDFLVRHDLAEPEKFLAWRDRTLSEFCDEIEAAGERHDTYVLSSEHFSSRVLTDEAVIELAQFLSTRFSEVRVVCYLRRQDEMAVSRINEGLRAGFPRRQFPTTKGGGRLPPLYDYYGIFKRWSLAFGSASMHLRIFDRSELVGGDIVKDFSETQLGVPLDFDEEGAPNVSLNANAQLALMMFNEVMGPESRLKVVAQRRELAAYLERVAAGPGYKPIRASALNFYELFRESNNRLAREYFKKDRLFDERFDSYPNCEADPDIRAASSLLSEYFEHRYVE